MPDDDRGLTEVLRAAGPDGLTWRVLAGGDQEDLATYVERRHGEAYAMSGFQGPALYPGDLINSWTGQADGTPAFVLIRVAPLVTTVTVIGATGREHAVELSDVVEPFHLKFGATPLPQEATILELRVGTNQTPSADAPPWADK